LILRYSPFFPSFSLFLQLEKLEFNSFSPDLEHEPKIVAWSRQWQGL
jgi:hypothetical protein